jgi:pimeloyl-ACP methyl ester carboxylesterase
LAFWARVAGVADDFVIADEFAADVVTEAGHGWQLRYDTRASALGGAPIVQLLALSGAPVTVVRGEQDPIVSADDAAELGRDVVTVAGAGHSPQLDRPGEIALLTARTLSSTYPAESAS